MLLSAEVAVTDELTAWILSWGAQAEVLEPLQLREALRREAQALLETYSGTG